MRFKYLIGKWLWTSFLVLCVPFAVAAEEAAVPAELQRNVKSATEVFDSLHAGSICCRSNVPSSTRPSRMPTASRSSKRAESGRGCLHDPGSGRSRLPA